MSRFDQLRHKLADERLGERVKKPLAYWALPRDRRLPYALLDRTVSQIIDTPFDELSATPGIGRKKIASLVMLLNRVLMDDKSDEGEDNATVAAHFEGESNGRFDLSTVSESLWEMWRATARRHELGREKLGRLAPSLQALPTVIWHTPLDRYLDLDFAEVRRLKTHGDKRVAAVLEVFHAVHQVLAPCGRYHRLTIRLLPSFVPSVEQWISAVLECDRIPSVGEMRQNLALPLLNQIEIDAGETVHRLAAGRLSIEAAPQSVREQSRRLRVTRARVYQLLDVCAHVMGVRWPEGRCLLDELAGRLETLGERDERWRLLRAIQSLVFPEKIERTAEPLLA